MKFSMHIDLNKTSYHDLQSIFLQQKQGYYEKHTPQKESYSLLSLDVKHLSKWNHKSIDVAGASMRRPWSYQKYNILR